MSKKYRRKPYGKRGLNTREGRLLFRFILILVGIFIVGYAMTLVVSFAVAFVKAYPLPIILTFSLVVSATIAYFIMRVRRQRRNRSSVVYHIIDALKIMDSIGHRYTNEEEANKELAGILKSKGLKVDYQLQNNFGRPDAIVNGSIIEGKLDLVSLSEVDRLIGQLQRYCQSNRRVCVVIYGSYNPDYIRRISQVTPKFPNQIQTAYLPNANRRR